MQPPPPLLLINNSVSAAAPAPRARPLVQRQPRSSRSAAPIGCRQLGPWPPRPNRAWLCAETVRSLTRAARPRGVGGAGSRPCVCVARARAPVCVHVSARARAWPRAPPVHAGQPRALGLERCQRECPEAEPSPGMSRVCPHPSPLPSVCPDRGRVPGLFSGSFCSVLKPSTFGQGSQERLRSSEWHVAPRVPFNSSLQRAKSREARPAGQRALGGCIHEVRLSNAVTTPPAPRVTGDLFSSAAAQSPGSWGRCPLSCKFVKGLGLPRASFDLHGHYLRQNWAGRPRCLLVQETGLCVPGKHSGRQAATLVLT